MSKQEDIDHLIGIVKALASEEVETSLVSAGRTLVISVKPAKEDIGKILGRGGENFKGLRTLARNIGAKYGDAWHLELDEDK